MLLVKKSFKHLYYHTGIIAQSVSWYLAYSPNLVSASWRT
jgi:hypothetical protein